MLALEIVSLVLSAISTAITIFSFLIEKTSLKIRLIFLATTVFLVICTVFIIFVPKNSNVADTEKKPETTPVATIPPNIGLLQNVYLDQLTPIIQKPNSFSENAWNKFYELKIDDTTYDHGIGVSLPEDIYTQYPIFSCSSRRYYSQKIEYNLRKKYQGMEFSYGIDRTTFFCTNENTPSCQCKLLFESANPKSLLYDSDWFDYATARFDQYLDLEQVDTLSITVIWKFDTNPSQNYPLNLAIVNAILYLKDS